MLNNLSTPADFVAKIGKRPLYSAVAPIAILSGHSDHPLLNLILRPKASGTAAGTVGNRPTLLKTIESNVESRRTNRNEGNLDFLDQDLGNNASRELIGESFV